MKKYEYEPEGALKLDSEEEHQRKLAFNKALLELLNKGIPFDEAYEKAKKLWGDTPAYKEYEEKTKGYTHENHKGIADNMMAIFGEFGAIKDQSVSSDAAHALVRKLQDFITAHYYTCTDVILAGLGEIYGSGGEFTKNINAAAGEGAAEFASKAIKSYCGKLLRIS